MRRPPPWGLALVGVAAVISIAATLQISNAAYDAWTSGSATFGSASCYHRASTQTGTATSSSNGTTTVAITAVDPTKAFLLFSSRHSLNRPVGSELRGRLATTTSLEFVRVTDEAFPVTMTIEWSVVEYTCGVTVQRGAVAPSATTVDVAISPVPSLSTAFVTWSKTPSAGDQIFDSNDTIVVDLSAADTLQIRTNLAAADHVVWWQVVAFADAGTINVQRGSSSLLGTATSTTATITAVDLTKTFVLASVRTDSNGAEIGSAMFRARLTNSTTLTLDRGVGNFDMTEIGWQVIQLLDGSVVQSGATTLGAGVATATPAISAVPLARSSVFASAHTGSGQNGGRTAYVTDDIVGVAALGLRLTSTTQVTLTRNNTAASTDVAWFVVTWGRA